MGEFVVPGRPNLFVSLSLIQQIASAENKIERPKMFYFDMVEIMFVCFLKLSKCNLKSGFKWLSTKIKQKFQY